MTFDARDAVPEAIGLHDGASIGGESLWWHALLEYEFNDDLQRHGITGWNDHAVFLMPQNLARNSGHGSHHRQVTLWRLKQANAEQLVSEHEEHTHGVVPLAYDCFLPCQLAGEGNREFGFKRSRHVVHSEAIFLSPGEVDPKLGDSQSGTDTPRNACRFQHPSILGS